MEITLINAPDLAKWLNDDKRPQPTLLDVREFSEVQLGQIPNSLHMSMHSVPTRLNELSKEVPVVCICHHGVRSMQVARFLKQHDFEQVINLTGGIHAWAMQVDPEMQKY